MHLHMHLNKHTCNYTNTHTHAPTLTHMHLHTHATTHNTHTHTHTHMLSHTDVAVLIVSGVSQHALLPLICAFGLEALVRGAEVHSAVVVAKEHTLSGGAYV